jgi:hypothetical protein
LDSDKTGEKSLSATQELKPPTVADVIEVFQLFREDLLKQIDKRDENVVASMQKMASDFLAEYTRLAAADHDHVIKIANLERRMNDFATELTALKLKVERVGKP